MNQEGGPTTAASSLRTRTFVRITAPLAIACLLGLLIGGWKRHRDHVALAQENLLEVATAGSHYIRYFDTQPALLKQMLDGLMLDRRMTYALYRGTDGTVIASAGAAPVGRRISGQSTVWIENGVVHGVSVVNAQDGTAKGALELGTAIRDSVGWLEIVGTVVMLAIAVAVGFLFSAAMTRRYGTFKQQLAAAANELATSVEIVSQAVTDHAAGMTQHAEALGMTNSTADDVISVGKGANERAEALMNDGQRAQHTSQEGLSSVESAIGMMREVRERMSTLASTVSALPDRAAAIGQIAGTVGQLAERSNLLALNAAIEASRAGTQGRGFSVVAQEMRSLADGSTRSAAQVRAIVDEIQAAIARAAVDAPEGKRRVEKAAELAEHAGNTIRRFAEVTQEVLTAGSEFARMATQQDMAIQRLVEGISQASTAAAGQLEMARELSSTTEKLRSLSKTLMADVGPGQS